MGTRRGFTIIELLVVILIITLLSGMLMPMLGVIQRTTMKSRTGFILKKVDTALREFKDEYGVYPYQVTYPEPVDAATYPNRLAYSIGTDLTDAARANIKTDLDAVAAAYNYNATFNYSSWSEGASQPAPNVVFRGSYVGNDVQKSYLANRMAYEQNRLAVIAGDLKMHGQYISNPTDSSLLKDLRGTDVLTAPASAAEPGWATDYLRGEIDRRYINGDAILDAWGTPLIYICQAIPGERGTPINLAGAVYFGRVNNKSLGLGPLGFDTNAGPSPGFVSAGRPKLLYGGRVRLSRVDAGDGQPTPSDTTYFPDPSDLMHSDARFYAAPGFETEFELWSAGPDRRFQYMRDDAANRDNVSTLPYNRLLKND